MKSLEAQNGLSKVASGWDRLHGLRSGDRIVNSEEAKLRKESKLPTPHPNQWTLPGMIRTAFRAIGHSSMPRGASGVGETHDGLASMSVTARIFELAQLESVSSFRAAVEAGQVRSLVVSCHYDATPVLVKFGALHEDLWAHARYLHRDGERWRLLKFDDFQKLSKRAAPRSGVVELFAQSRCLYYKSGGAFQQ